MHRANLRAAATDGKTTTTQLVAVKTIQDAKVFAAERQQLVALFSRVARARHHFVELLAECPTEQVLVLELMAGDMQTVLTEQGSKLNGRVKLRILLDLGYALHLMHTVANMAHGDVKPANLLLARAALAASAPADSKGQSVLYCCHASNCCVFL